MRARMRSDPRAKRRPFSLQTDMGQTGTDSQGDYRAHSESRPLINIDVYANCYKNIPHDSRVMGNFRKLIWDGRTGRL